MKQSSSSTQSGHLSLGRSNEYQRYLGSKQTHGAMYCRPTSSCLLFQSVSWCSAGRKLSYVIIQEAQLPLSNRASAMHLFVAMSYARTLQDISFQTKEHWWTEESLAVNMRPAATGHNQIVHTELHKKTSRFCERWDGHLERASRKTV